MVTDNDKRRLPVLQAPSEQPEEARPVWHWVGFGAVAIFVAWLPLAYFGESLGRRLALARLGGATVDSLARRERLEVLAMIALPQVAALAIAGAFGGFLVTRFGVGTKRRDAAAAGAVVGLLALGLTYAQVGFSIAALVVPILAALASAAGGALGARRK
jgi:hypothetical protein